MTTITVPRATVERAIKLICSARLCEINSMSSRHEMLRLLIEATDILRTALAQQAEPVEPVAWAPLPKVPPHIKERENEQDHD